MSDSLFHQGIENSQRILYTPSDFARVHLLHLQEIGALTAQEPHRSQRSGLSSYLFFLVDKGSGTLWYEDTPYTLTVGDCVFLDCHNPYYHESSADLWSLRWVHFDGPSMRGIYEKYRERGGLARIHPENLSDFSSLWTRLYEIAGSTDYIRDMRLSEALFSLLTLLMEKSWHPALRRASSKRQNLLQVKEYLDTHYAESIVLDDLASRFYISKFYLSRIFKEQFGVSIGDYLLQVRITHAKQLLRFSRDSLDAIAAACGFGTLYYFSRMFKKVEGISPSTYRKEW